MPSTEHPTNGMGPPADSRAAQKASWMPVIKGTQPIACSIVSCIFVIEAHACLSNQFYGYKSIYFCF